MKRQYHQLEAESRRARYILTGVVLAAVVVLATLFGWQFWRLQPRAPRLQSQPISSAPPNEGQQTAITACYRFELPSDFEVNARADCGLNAYARPRKYAYVNVAPYYDASSEEAMKEQWRSRWLTLGAEVKSEAKTVWGGKPAWKIVRYYPQNNEQLVSYLFLIDKSFTVDGKEPIRAIELTAWYGSDADRELVDRVMASWQWRW